MILSRWGMQGRTALLSHIERTGCTIAGDPVWTEAEIAALRSAHPDFSAATAALSRRSPVAISHKARQLGLCSPRRVWTEDEGIRLRRPYVSGISIAEIALMFPDKSRRQIWHKAHHLGYRRPRRAPRLTGMPLVDSIRQRAFEYRVSMTDLDAFVGHKYYFVSPRYVNWRALQKAMQILGGRPVVYWPGG